MEAFFIKTTASTLVPATDRDRELLKHIKIGQPTKLTFKRVRNYEFHKKYFALLDYAYDIWEPENEVAEKNRDQFREDLIILAGFYIRLTRLDNTTRIKAKSISFGSMSEDEFEKLYTKTLDVVIKYVCRNYTADVLRDIVAQLEDFE